MIDIIRWFAIQKWRITIGYSVIGILGIGLVVAKTAQDILKQFNVFIPLYTLGIVGLAIIWIAGLLYERLGIFSAEAHYASEKNTYFEKYMKDRKR